MPIRIAIVGYGKIAEDQHLPAIRANPKYELVAVVSPRRDPGIGVPNFTSLDALIEGMKGKLDAVALCTPPVPRHDIARDALKDGLAVLLEKPPAATLGEIEHLEELARKQKGVLYAAWHAQHNAGVAAAKAALAGKEIAALHISWFEDVRKWHPGQEWIWQPGGFGVFDPGINALSIATRILPEPLFVREAVLSFPESKQAPIAASLTFAGDDRSAEMDWRYTEGERWEIDVETADGIKLALSEGGAVLAINGVRQPGSDLGEYPSIYARFAELVEQGASEVDTAPLRIVADAYLVGRRETVAAFV